MPISIDSAQKTRTKTPTKKATDKPYATKGKGITPNETLVQLTQAMDIAHHVLQEGEFGTLSSTQKIHWLSQFTKLIEADSALLAKLEHEVTEKPLEWIQHHDIPLALDFLRQTLSWLSDESLYPLSPKLFSNQTPHISGPNGLTYHSYDPASIVVHYIRSDFPLLDTVKTLCLTIASGCPTLLIIPPDQGHSILYLFQHIVDTTLPSGSLQLVTAPLDVFKGFLGSVHAVPMTVILNEHEARSLISFSHNPLINVIEQPNTLEWSVIVDTDLSEQELTQRLKESLGLYGYPGKGPQIICVPKALSTTVQKILKGLTANSITTIPAEGLSLLLTSNQVAVIPIVVAEFESIPKLEIALKQGQFLPWRHWGRALIWSRDFWLAQRLSKHLRASECWVNGTPTPSRIAQTLCQPNHPLGPLATLSLVNQARWVHLNI